MNRPRLRVPRSLLKYNTGNFAEPQPAETPRSHVSCNTESTAPTSSETNIPKPSLTVSPVFPSQTNVTANGPLTDLVTRRFALHDDPFREYKEALPLDGLKDLLGSKTALQLRDFKQKLQSTVDRHTEACTFLEAQRESENRETQKTLHLYEHASMTHEDRTGHLRRDADALSRQQSEASTALQEFQCTANQLENALSDSEKTLKTSAAQLQLLENQKAAESWRSTATLQLLAQMNDALREFHLYRERLVLYRSVVEAKRREFHNRLQDLRGNLRVLCRIRPPLEGETDSDGLVSFTVSKDETRLGILSPDAKSKTGGLSPHPLSSPDTSLHFRFDRVFTPTTSQEDVFHEVSNLVQSALDGFNVALFAYGQTGSGKTYTMEGKGVWDRSAPIATTKQRSVPYEPSPLPPTAGVVPRAMDLVFRIMDESITKGWQYKTELSILEVYNETIRDLLGSTTERTTSRLPSTQDATSVGHLTARSLVANCNAVSGGTSSCEVRLDAKGNTILTNVISVPVRNSKEVYHYLLLAQKQRSVAATACNEHSSRSHSIFQLKIYGQRLKDKRTIHSVLSMVDLAGSERVDKSLVTGDRLREAQYINRSLSCLGDVIHAIAGKKPHVPFRNSKLTMILKDSLGGQAKTLMFVNISPLRIHLSETVTSLRFAVKANACNLT